MIHHYFHILLATYLGVFCISNILATPIAEVSSSIQNVKEQQPASEVAIGGGGGSGPESGTKGVPPHPFGMRVNLTIFK